MKVLFVSMVVICLILSGVLYAQVAAVTSQQSSGTVQQSASNPKIINDAPTYVPNKISYQGLLTTPLGAPVPDGLYEIKFELFNDLSAGASQWVETQTNITVKQGTFSVLLGSVSPLLGIFYQPLWLEVTAISGSGISSPIMFSPRTELGSAAYSLGPWLQHTNGYYLNNISASIGAPPGNFYGRALEGLDVKPGTQFAGVRVQSTYTSGFWADKPDASGRNYLVLTTGEADRWSLGTMYNDNFGIYNWPNARYDFYATMEGLVGIGTTSPTKKLDVNGSVQIKDTLLVGSSIVDGVVNVFQSGAEEPTIKVNKYPGGFGGQITLQDELGNPIVDLRPNGWGEGGGVRAYRNATQVGFEGWGNWYGLGEGFAAVYGNNRSILFEPRFAGDQSVQLPDSSISATEILDEPGIARAGSGSSYVIARNTVVNIRNASITVPGPGYIVAHGFSLCQINGDTIGSMIGGIELAGTTSPLLTEAVLVGSTNERLSAVTYRWTSLNTSRTFYVSAAGTYTYYFNVARYSSYQAGSHTIYWPKLDLAYYPTSYGTVGAAIPEMEASAFVNPSTESVSMPGDNSTTTTKYTVDLRELELRAATARIKAEKAERELMEAKMNLQNGSQR